MVKFGTQTLPNVNHWRIRHPRNSAEQPIPGRSVAYREDMGGLGASIEISGVIYPKDYPTMSAIKALADGTTRTLDLELTGAPTYQCIMLDPEFEPQPIEKPLSINYQLRFNEINNP